MHTDINRSIKRLAITCLWNWKWRTTVLQWFVIPRCVSLLDIPHLPVVILNPVVLGVVAEAEGSEWALVTLSHGVLPPCMYCILLCFTSMTHGGERIDGMNELETTCCSVFFWSYVTCNIMNPTTCHGEILVTKVTTDERSPLFAHGYIIVFPLWLPLARLLPVLGFLGTSSDCSGPLVLALIALIIACQPCM